ncbi:hypothetical protein DFP96_102416 [Listeria rocourtiae]|uniref:Uncharacterized protein n=1 Tax=Listeria rocourtiae TaxID=647910 RepID=A0A4R6ZQD5_9LIST|nr:hypothetical protein PROCOU_05953 [Listeria rocourtiae FSL F6-920]TDR54821.1 hypothetical protein DFP96_102416 [Listeria rocourtiae]
MEKIFYILLTITLIAVFIYFLLPSSVNLLFIRLLLIGSFLSAMAAYYKNNRGKFFSALFGTVVVLILWIR